MKTLHTFLLTLSFCIMLASSSLEDMNTISMESVDIKALIEEDLNITSGPFRHAHSFDVNINLFNDGTVQTLENGDQIWTLQVHSADAVGLKLYFDDFYLPFGSELLIYNEEQDMVVGPLTSADNHEDQEFGHRLLKGDIIILQYLHPANSSEQALINISKVYHSYRDILGFYETQSERNCGVNVACDNGEFEDQINSVIFLDMGGYICSAALINNTSFDLTPYVLTANHCVEPENPGEHNYFTFYFKHQSSSCSGSSGNYNYSRTGSDLRASYYYSDFALLEMDYAPAASFNGYYAGWDRSSSSPQVSAGVHHPGGAPKKINYDNDNAYSDGWYSSNTHWRLTWDEGGTEGGSSGSPLFDDNKVIVGQLHGGTGECGNGTDYYGKLYTSWTGGGTSSTRLSNWLDPGGTGETYITGTYNGEGGGDPAEITLITPNGPESWEAGSSYQIIWDDNFDSNISLKLYKSGVYVETIVSSTASDGSYSWSIPSDTEEGNDYKIKITHISQSTVYDYSDSYFSISGAGSVSLSIDSVNTTSTGGNIDIYMENDTPVAGYQFVISDSPDNIIITDLEDLASSGFTVSSSESGIVLGFSLLGSTIDEGSGLLVSAEFETLDGDEVEICLEDPIFSNAGGNPIVVNLGDCLDVDLYQIMIGDFSFDGVINVLDAVLLVNGVLAPETLDESQLLAADINGDDTINVLDLVLLISIILEV